MAGTVIEYLQKYGDISFREKPLNDVDSLALCQLSYLKFDGMVSDVRHNGPSVTLREMKPEKLTPAHQTADFAELCCSNSLRAAGLENAVGLLKEELRQLGSLIVRCADETAVPAGGALAVDRHGFSRLVTERVRSHPLITVVPGEVTDLPEGVEKDMEGVYLLSLIHI